jgi:hypothetical protein
MRIELLRCPELLAVECWIAEAEIKVGILIPNPRQPPRPGALTLYDASTQPPTPYPATLPPDLNLTETTYRVTLPRNHGSPL